MPLTNDNVSSSASKGKHLRTTSASSLQGRPSASDNDPSQPKFPRIEDCTHFHYENVDYGRIKVSFLEDSSDGLKINGSLSLEGFKPAFCVRISCKGNSWVVRRSLSHFETLDVWLHECVFDRRFSHLPQLRENNLKGKTLHELQEKLQTYLAKLSAVTDVNGSGGQISCAPILHWLEIDSHGRNLAPHALGDVADINIPAVAAARVVRRYQAHDDDELSLDVGDMVSIIEMGATGWWRGKQGLKVGSFPAQCVRRINSATDVVGTHERPFSPPLYGAHVQLKPIAQKHGKFMDFLRSFLSTRPSKAHLKQKGILRERVFGCDLGELLHRTGDDIPTVVTDCTKFVESHGIVDGIYRISGVASHIRHLRYEFDSDRRPDLESDVIGLPKLGHVPGMSRDGNMICDPHSVAGLCKLFFRELPNPLLSYQLYNRFASAVTDYEAEERLLKVHDVIQQLPPPHYRTLKHLITHLRFMAQQDDQTSMHCRNLAIVWAPNLLRSREIEAGLQAFMEARVQSVVTEFLIVNGDLLFSDKLQTMQYDADHKPPRPRSLMILSPPKLISLEEAQARSKTGVVTPVSSESTSFSADNPSSGVRMREASDSSKSSSYERRKRQHKKITATSATHNSHSPHPVARSTIRQGHRHTASYIEALSPPDEPRQAWNVDTPATKHNPSHAAGWKTKLGSLLKKSSAIQGNSVNRESSLRRCQSDDSLVSSHSSQQKIAKASRALEFSRPSLSHAISCEESGLSDRSRPEPQVPHQVVGETSPVHLRDKSPHHTNPRMRHSRPAGGVYSDKDMKVLEQPFQLTFRKVGSRKSSRDGFVAYAEAPLRSSSPFSELASDFPGVMGENGLDFDPLSFRPGHSFSPIKQGAKDITKSNTGRKGKARKSHVEEGLDDLPNVVRNDKSPSSGQKVTVSIKRVASVQSLHGEPMFAAVSTISLHRIPPFKEEDEDETPGGSNKATCGDHSTSSHLDTLTAEAVLPTPVSSPKVASGTSALSRLRKKPVATENEQQQLESGNSKKSEPADGAMNTRLDALTADCITDAVPQSTAAASKKISAAEQLGLTRKTGFSSSSSNNEPMSKLLQSQKESQVLTNGGNQTTNLDLNENIKQPKSESYDKECLETVNESSDVDDAINKEEMKNEQSHVSVQYYTMPVEEGLQKKPHYGSFIALVGTNVETPPPKPTPGTSGVKQRGKDVSPRPSDLEPYQRPVNDQTPPRKWRHNSASTYQSSENDRIRQASHIRSQSATSHGSQRSYSSSNQSVQKFVGYVRDKVEFDSPVGIQRHACVYSPRLDTFNPEGKQRDDYNGGNTPPKYDQVSNFNYDLRRPKPIHGRSQSDDVQLHYTKYPVDKPATAHLRQPQQLYNSVRPPTNRNTQSTHQGTFYPCPAPRKHFRSYSAGDDIEHPRLPPHSHHHPQEHPHHPTAVQRKPIPLPRTSSCHAPKPIPRQRNPPRHSTGGCGASYNNRTYEEWHNTHPLLSPPAPDTQSQTISYSSQKQYFCQRDLEQRVMVPNNIPPQPPSRYVPQEPNVGYRASYAEGMSFSDVPAYNNPTYEEHRSYYKEPNFQRRSYADMTHGHPSMQQSVPVVQTSTALSWV